jgi:hypothetical protein
MNTYIEPTQESAQAVFSRDFPSAVIMLNLLRLNEIADYSSSPELAPAQPISGREAFQKYIEHTLPFLTESDGEILFLGDGGQFLIGPQAEHWDLVMLIKQSSLSAFIDFASNQSYMAGIGHRTSAIMDSRLLPLNEFNLEELD